MLVALTLLVVGAGVGVRVEEARGVSDEERDAFTSLLKSAIAPRTEGGRVAVDPQSGACEQTDRCVQDIRARVGTSDIVMIRLLGVPTRIRVLAELVKSDAPARAEIDLPRDRATWPASIDELAVKLFPAPMSAATTTANAITEAPVKPSETRWAPWVVIGGSALAGVVGVGFGLSSRAARDHAANEPHTNSELDDLEDRAIGHGLAANILFGTAVAGVATGVAWLLLGD